MNTTNMPKKIMLTGSVAALLVALAISPLWANNAPSRPAEADKLHVVLLVAGNDGNIGNADMKDIAAMRLAIDASFAKDKNRVVYHDLAGKNPKTGQLYTAGEIIGYLRAMVIGNNDNVLVFHSGHGCIADMSRPEETHVLTVDGGILARKEIRSILLAKNPRALMILSDCCSAHAPSLLNFVNSRDMANAPSVNVATVRNLLLKPAGIISITAAEDGTIAIATFHGDNPGQAGSAFTVALMRLWYKQDVTFTSWEQMFPALRTETHLASGGTHQARAFQIMEQGIVTSMPERIRN